MSKSFDLYWGTVFIAPADKDDFLAFETKVSSVDVS